MIASSLARKALLTEASVFFWRRQSASIKKRISPPLFSAPAFLAFDAPECLSKEINLHGKSFIIPAEYLLSSHP
ncbi:MAG: hypothetical protein Q8K77_00195 [Thermodesulfovibrionales bacterium]|nr:hypothetical protein [Thermodesulfovibrionales bacterium]